MQIAFSTNVAGDDVRPFRTAISPVMEYSDGSLQFAFDDITKRQVDQFLADLFESGLTIAKTAISIYRYDNDDWLSPPSEWVGAIVRGGDVIPVSEHNIFNPVLPLPCHGVVPNDAPIHVEELPFGQSVATDSTHLFHKQMLDLLASHDEFRQSPVYFRGQKLHDWNRILAKKFSCLDREFMFTYSCRACGSSGLADYGIPFGRKEEGSWVRTDIQGIGHLESEHPCLVSPDVAQALVRKLQFSGWLAPIVDRQSPLANRVLEVLSRLRHIRQTQDHPDSVN